MELLNKKNLFDVNDLTSFGQEIRNANSFYKLRFQHADRNSSY